MEDVVVLDVRDDGTGFAVEQVRAGASASADHGFGLRGMEQRLHRVAGSLAIESIPSEGTAISASVPAISLIEAGGAP
jgi:signal transduction histidine kinase